MIVINKALALTIVIKRTPLSYAIALEVKKYLEGGR